MESVVQRICNENPNLKVKIYNIDLWPYLKNGIHADIVNEKITNHKSFVFSSYLNFFKKIILIVFSNLKKVQYCFYGFLNWFSKYEYLVFSDSTERKLIVNNKHYDKLVDYLIEKLGSEKTLLIEHPAQPHYKKTKVYTKNIVSQAPISFITDFLIIFIKKPKKKIKQFSKLVKNYGINKNFYYRILRFRSEYYIFTALLKLYKPKIIFVNTRGKTNALYLAARKLKIPSVEIAHGRGMLDLNHTYSEIPNDYFPDKYLVMGEFSKRSFINHNSFKQNQIIPIGSLIVEDAKNKKTCPQFMDMIKNKFDAVINVSLQNNIEKQMLDLILQVSNKNPKIAFILIPRLKHKNPSEYFFEEKNIFIAPVDRDPNANFYSINKYCDAHITCYSTTSLESMGQGIPTILLDIDNKASFFLKNTENYYGIQKVNNINDLDIALEKIKSINIEKIKANDFIKSNFKKNIDNVIGHLGLNK